ncbi:MAG: hypothetical protein WC797_02750 [Candidatus Paceibacterota bacterium]|jgi:hypothetical protein
MSAEAFPQVEKIRLSETGLELPSVNGTYIAVLRNADDFRGSPKQMDEADKTPGGIEIGKLMPSSAEAAREFSEQQLNGILEGLSQEEKEQLDIIIVASNSALGPLAVPDGSIPPPHQRCVETGAVMLEGVEKAMERNGLKPEQLLNREIHVVQPRPIVLRDIEDIKMRPGILEYFDFLKERANELTAQGKKTNMWVLYEEDTYKTERERLGIEGPQDISTRMQKFVERAERLSSLQHKRTPDRRLLVLAVAPRDVVGPWLNIQVSKLSPERHEVPMIENLAGFGITIDSAGKASLKIAGQEHPLSE